MKVLQKTFSIGVMASILTMGTLGVAHADDVDRLLVSTEQSGTFVTELEFPVLPSSHATEEDPNAPFVIVPGDHYSNGFSLKNDGPDPGVLKVYVVDVNNSGPQATETDKFFTEDLTFTANEITHTAHDWSPEGLAEAVEGTEYFGVQIHEAPLAPGEENEFDISVDFPVESESGNRAGYNAKQSNGEDNDYEPGSRESSYRIYAVLSGEYPEEDKPSIAPTPDQTPSPSAPKAPDHNTPANVRTGGEAFIQDNKGVLAAGALLVLAIAAGILGFSRRIKK